MIIFLYYNDITDFLKILCYNVKHSEGPYYERVRDICKGKKNKKIKNKK